MDSSVYFITISFQAIEVLFERLISKLLRVYMLVFGAV
jgi:hypothetical protein